MDEIECLNPDKASKGERNGIIANSYSFCNFNAAQAILQPINFPPCPIRQLKQSLKSRFRINIDYSKTD